jgi:hypothetical protein
VPCLSFQGSPDAIPGHSLYGLNTGPERPAAAGGEVVSQPLRYTPDHDHRFFCYSPEGDGLTFWATAEERDAYAADEIRTYLDEGEWAEEVKGLFVGGVTHITKAIDIEEPQGELDEDGYDENGDGPWPSPHCTRCNYALLPLPAAPGEASNV